MFRRERSVGRGAGGRERSVGSFRREFPSGAFRRAGGGWRADLLVVAQKQTTSREILLWMTPSEAPKALQASECSELLDPTGASCWIFAQR